MAAPTVVATTEGIQSSSGVGSATISFPSGSTAGDLIVIVWANATNAPMNYTLGDGFQQLLDANTFAIFYKQIDGTEGGNMVVTQSANGRSVWTVYRITGHADPAVQPPQIGTTATGDNVNPNPPSISPTGGSKDYLFIACFSNEGECVDDDAWLLGIPSNYGTPLAKSTGTTSSSSNNRIVASAHRTATTATENPGTFTVRDPLPDNHAWQAQTIAIHPAGGAAELERSAAIAAASAVTIAAAGFSILERSAAISASAAVAAVAERELERTAAISASATIATSAEAFTLFDRSSAIAATAALTVAETERDLLRASALAAASAVTIAHERELMRSAALAGTSAVTIAASGFSIIEASAALAASTSVAAAFERELTRAAVLAATASLQVGHERELMRAVALAASADLEIEATTANVIGTGAALSAASAVTVSAHERELQRAAALSAASAVTATYLRLLGRQVGISAVTGAEIVTERDLQRAVAIAATSAVVSAVAKELERTLGISASAALQIAAVRLGSGIGMPVRSTTDVSLPGLPAGVGVGPQATSVAGSSRPTDATR